MRGKCCRQGPLVVGHTPSFKPAHLHNALSSRTHLPIPPPRHLPLSPILMLIVSQHILITYTTTCTRSTFFMDDFTPFSHSYGYIESNVTTYTDHFLARSISTHPSFSPTLPWRLTSTSAISLPNICIYEHHPPTPQQYSRTLAHHS
jgi:hypothetical protein